VHVSDFSWTKRIKDPKEIQEMYKKGDEIEAVVLDIDSVNERLSLGVKQLSNDPWEVIPQRYPLGTKVKGKITSITDFGVFVEIEEGTEGLIHSSQLGIEKGQSPAEFFQLGTEIEAEVTNIDRDERRISLSVRAVKRRQEKEQMAEFMEDQSAPVTFGDLLRQKIEPGQ
jgi:small subunit ribosomal protein S1